MADYISRSAAIDALCKTCPLKGAECLETEECAPFKHIQAIPAAEVQPVKRGKWERQELAPTGWRFCDKCGGVHKRGKLPNFCPNCGAEMGG